MFIHCNNIIMYIYIYSIIVLYLWFNTISLPQKEHDWPCTSCSSAVLFGLFFVWLFHHLLVRKLWIDFYPKTFLQNHEPLLIRIRIDPGLQQLHQHHSILFKFYTSALQLSPSASRCQIFVNIASFGFTSYIMYCILCQCYVHGKAFRLVPWFLAAPCHNCIPQHTVYTCICPTNYHTILAGLIQF